MLSEKLLEDSPLQLCHQILFLAPLPGSREVSARGVSQFQSLYFVLVLLIIIALSCFAFLYQKHKKISVEFILLLSYIKNPKKLVTCLFLCNSVYLAFLKNECS